MTRRTLHAAIIMDGNGRWAAARGLPRLAGHRAGADAVRRTVEAAGRAGLGALTLFAFSSDNWRRPAPEVDALLRLFESHLYSEGERCAENDVHVEIVGRRDRLPPTLLAAIATVEATTAYCEGLQLRIAVDYSGRDAILHAARGLGGDFSRESLARSLAPEVDLLIRTGGEQRLSDFLLWESAYAELVFLPVMWPDFDAGHLEQALAEFHSRERRFGGVPQYNDASPGGLVFQRR